MALDDILGQIGATALEVPEEVLDALGQGLSAVGDKLQEAADMIAKLQDAMRGSKPSA